MKKIVGIVAAAAMAASMFAVDFNATVKLSADAVSLSSAAGSTVKVLDLKDDWAKRSSFDDNCLWISGNIDDIVGASFAVYTVSKGDEKLSDVVKAGRPTIWFKPMDAVKVTVGRPWCSLDGCSFGDGDNIVNLGNASDWANDYAGFMISLAPEGGFSADLLLLPGYGNAVYDGKNLCTVGAKIGFSADFGTVAAMVGYNGQYVKTAEKAGKPNYFIAGLGYNTGALLDIGSLWLDGKVEVYNNKFQSMNVAAEVALAPVDAISANVYANFGYTTTAALKLEAQLAYKMDNGMSIYVYAKDDDLFAKTFGMTVAPGVKGNFGAMSWKVQATMGLGTTFTLAVPVTFTVGF